MFLVLAVREPYIASRPAYAGILVTTWRGNLARLLFSNNPGQQKGGQDRRHGAVTAARSPSNGKASSQPPQAPFVPGGLATKGVSE